MSLSLFGGSTIRFLAYTSGASGACVYYGILNQKQRRTFRTNKAGIKRFAILAGSGYKIVRDYKKNVKSLIVGSDEYDKASEQFHERTSDLIYNAALSNKGLYIKLGQSVASCNHVFPAVYVKKLAQLNDQALISKEDDLDQILMEDFGRSVNQMYSEFNREPIASASIAEVFEARLRESGVKVAIKIQFIDLQDRFGGDIWTIKFLMDIAEYWFPGFNFKWAVIELCDTIKQELDFINEGRNAEKCAEDLKGFDYVHVPKVFWEHTSRRVLTTEFIDAVKIDDAEGMKAQGIDIKSACEKMCRVFGYQIFQSGFVHADPHPGNLFVRKHPTKKGDVELVILDHGLYQKVDHIVQTKLGNFWKSMILDDRKSLLMNGRELGVIGLHDTAILAAILLQRPWYVNVPFSSYFKTVTAEDFQHMRGFVENHFNKVMAVLRAIPISLLLVVRNINTIRSIMQTHGEPVNRYRIMTDCTVKRDWTSLGSYLRLQYRLFLMDTKEWMHKMILRLFITLSQSGIPYFTDGLNRLSLEEPQSVLNPS
ncbi:putative aarF domain-containing protein kinase 5 isoform X4 [Convolutriloba macropyga]|uniref:putative aarF domain-containing protein kinase 5 isoform X4 n=1 Tax=Convolutriloba macropyga TaxID=536237 RepID=UPI003F525842